MSSRVARRAAVEGGAGATAARALVLALLYLAGCAEDDTTTAAGTGSSGGNPATEDLVTVNFQLESASPEGRVSWLSARLAPERIRLARATETGDCAFDDADELTDIDLIRFDLSELASVNARDLCALRVLPGPDAPLLSILGQTVRFDIDVSFWLDDGIELSLLTARRWAEGERDWVIVLDPERFTSDVDLQTLADADSRITLSDRDPDFREALRRRLAEAVEVYVDPTPGDGRVTAEEQTAEYRIGGLRLVDASTSDTP